MALNLTDEQQEKLNEALSVAGARVILSQREGENYSGLVLDLFKCLATENIDAFYDTANTGYADEMERVELFDEVGGSYGNLGIIGHETSEESKLRELKVDDEKRQKVRSEGVHNVFYAICHFEKFFVNLGYLLPTKHPAVAKRFQTSDEARNYQIDNKLNGYVVKVDLYALEGYGYDYDVIPVTT